MGITRSENYTDFADDEPGSDEEFLVDAEDRAAKTPGNRRKSSWRDIEDYFENKRLQKLLDDFDYD